MSLDTLHRTYAPILHMAQGERFYPMDARDLLTYAALYRAGQRQPTTPASALPRKAIESGSGIVTSGPGSVSGRRMWVLRTSGLLPETLWGS